MNRKQIVAARWAAIAPGTEYRSPTGRASFTVTDNNGHALRVTRAGGTRQTITLDQANQVIDHLERGGHDAGRPCRIDSNKRYEDAGDLCRAARTVNGARGPMAVTYVLPILAGMGVVSINPDLPSTTHLR